MPYRLSPRSGLWRRFVRAVVVFHLIGLGVPSVAADRVGDEIRNLLQAGEARAALDEAENALGGRPGDPELMLLRAGALEAVGEVDQAVRALEELIRKHPSAPEPYNNLARLHALQGDLDKAREVLEQGLAGDPAYATLYQNLSGVYEAQARTAYAKALDLGTADPKPDLKPLLVLRASEPPGPASSPSVPDDPVEPDRADVVAKVEIRGETPDPPIPEPVEPAGETPVPEPSPEPAPSPQPVAAVEIKAAAELANAPEPEQEPEPEVFTPDPVEALLAWAKAWSAKDSAGYLAAYSGDFLAPGGDRATWAQRRRQRIGGPKWIKVRLDRFHVSSQGDGTTVVTAYQRYRSNTFKSTVRKRWTLTLENSEWRILSERVLR